MDLLFLILSIFIFFLTIILVLTFSKVGKIKSSIVFLIGTAVSICILFIPIYYDYFNKNIINTIFISIHNTIRVFVVDADFEFVKESIELYINENIQIFYNISFAAMYIVAPCLTAGFLLSLLINIKSEIKLYLNLNKNIYIFSLLNTKTIALAKSIKKSDKKNIIVLMDIDKDSEEYNEFYEDIKKLQAIIFQKKIYDLKLHNLKRKNIYIFLMNNYENTLDEEINTSLIRIVNEYKYYNNIKVYAFSGTVESELIVSSIGQKEANEQLETYKELFNDKEKEILSINDINDIISQATNNINKYKKSIKNNQPLDDTELNNIKTHLLKTATLINKINLPTIEVHRIDYAKNMIYSILPSLNNSLFNNQEQNIDVVVVGLGNYGKLITKTLAWYTQIPNKKLICHCITNDIKNMDILKGQAPGLFNPEFNNYVEGECCLEIREECIENVEGIKLTKYLENIPQAKLIVVSLGQDELNINVAARIRSLYKRLGKEPKIITVVYNNEVIDSIKYAAVKKDYYNIDYIGSVNEIYNKDTILNSNIEKMGLVGHLQYENKPFEENDLIKQLNIPNLEELNNKTHQYALNSYYLNEYNYNSSLASAIHYEYVLKPLKLFGLDKESQTEEEKLAMAINEHRRWDAYVYSVGFLPTPHHDKKERNDLAKTHHDLRNYFELHKEEQIKDQTINEAHKVNNK